MSSAIIPRPIAWVSSVDADGLPNLAPFSYFSAVCSSPPTVLFCSGIRSRTGLGKDTHHNIEATGEFVVNFVTERLAEAMNITATELPPQVDEFDYAGLTAAAGHTVRVPHVAETPIYFECKLREIVTISEEPGGGVVIIGTVTFIHVDDAIRQDDGSIDLDAYQAIGRTTGSGYVRTRDRFDLVRPPAQINKLGR
jgi:flavin reductase (DIM6/NTAB) family NADH-FMN oxidoreductase RutF